jgi:hypothetical protein
MFFLKTIVITFILLAATNITYSKIPLKISIDYSQFSPHVIFDKIKFSIRSDNKTFDFEWDSLYSDSKFMDINSGKYIVTGVLFYDGKIDSLKYDINVIGNEKKIQILASCTADSTEGRFDHLVLLKTFAAPKELTVTNKFKFNIGDEPEFLISNKTSKTFYSFNIHNYYWGNISQYVNNNWNVVNNNSVCLSYISNNHPLDPDSTVTATILPSYFYSDRFSFREPGKYKFSMQLTEELYKFPLGRLRFKTKYATIHIYELEHEFTI